MAKKNYVNIAGTYKQNKKLYVNIAGTWKEVKKAYVNVSTTWKQVHSAGTLPQGIILPYLSSSALPANFSEFSLADDNLIVGAGSTYTAGDSGGSSSVSVSTSTSNTGGHAGTNYFTTGSALLNASNKYGSANAGAHSHNVSGTNNSVLPTYRETRLIKATSEVDTLPINVGTFSVDDLSTTLTEVTTTDRYFKPNATDGGEGGSNTASVTVTSASAGAHWHGTTTQRQGGNSENENTTEYNSDSTGAHTHNSTVSGSIALKHKYLALWKHASSEVDIVGKMIGMYEGSTAPDGWKLCDGTLSTPDMRDFFLRLKDLASAGTSSNGSALSLSGTTTSGVSHEHSGVAIGNGGASYSSRHFNNVATSGHNISASPSYTPPYYALTFIMKED